MALRGWAALRDLFMPTQNVGEDFALSAIPVNRGDYEFRFKRLPNPNPVGVNNIMPDTEMSVLRPLQGSGTIYKDQSSSGLNGPAVVVGQVIANQAIIDPSGQIDFGTILGGSTDGRVDPNFNLSLVGGGPY